MRLSGNAIIVLCRDYVARAKSNGRKQKVHGTACQQGDGGRRVI